MCQGEFITTILRIPPPAFDTLRGTRGRRGRSGARLREKPLSRHDIAVLNNETVNDDRFKKP